MTARRRQAGLVALVVALGLLAGGCSSAAPAGGAVEADAPATPAPSSPSPGPGSGPPSSPPSSAPAGDTTAPVLLALGDSVAAGVGAPEPAVDGYVPVLARRLAVDCGASSACGLSVRNLAVPGATTASLQRDQLPEAVALLRSDAAVRLVTVTVGGNDVFAPVLQSCGAAPDGPSCRAAVVSALQQADTGVDEVLRLLTDAAGTDTVVAVMAYYDPLPACRLASLQPLSQQVLEGSGGQPGLNDVLRARADEHGAVLVETADVLVVPEDFVGDLDCLHPSRSGHARIAQAFAAAVEDRLR